MEGFDAASFWIGLGLGLINGIALVCFTRSWRWAGLPPPGAGRPYNVNPPAPANIKPEVPPKAPPQAPARRHHLTVGVELRQQPNRPDHGPDLRR